MESMKTWTATVSTRGWWTITAPDGWTHVNRPDVGKKWTEAEAIEYAKKIRAARSKTTV